MLAIRTYPPLAKQTMVKRATRVSHREVFFVSYFLDTRKTNDSRLHSGRGSPGGITSNLRSNKASLRLDELKKLTIHFGDSGWPPATCHKPLVGPQLQWPRSCSKEHHVCNTMKLCISLKSFFACKCVLYPFCIYCLSFETLKALASLTSSFNLCILS